MPFMTNGKRDYKKELAWEKKGGSDKYAKKRRDRGKARTLAGLKVGDPREADHKRPLSSGGSNSPKNVRVVSAKANARKEVARKKRNAVAKKGKA